MSLNLFGLIDVLAFMGILFHTIYLYLTCSKYTSVFAAFKQSMRLRSFVLYLPLTPVIFIMLRLYPEYALLSTLVIAISASIAYLAHAQYHFFDVQGMARLNGIKRWLLGVEILAILTTIYLMVYLFLIVVVQAVLL